MKKLLSLFMIVILCASLCACSSLSGVSSYEKEMHNEMKKYAGSWRDGKYGALHLYEDGVYYESYERDLDSVDAKGTWDVRDGYIVLSYSYGGEIQVLSYKIIDTETLIDYNDNTCTKLD